MDARTMRKEFGRGLHTGLRVVWPILSGLLTLMVAMGIVVGLLEGWSLHESIYFSFVTGPDVILENFFFSRYRQKSQTLPFQHLHSEWWSLQFSPLFPVLTLFK